MQEDEAREHSSSGEDSVGGQGDDRVPSGKALLSKADLEANYSYSLNEAAVRLGVSRTTLKRACRYLETSPGC